jgi:hypothetical protein
MWCDESWPQCSTEAFQLSKQCGNVQNLNHLLQPNLGVFACVSTVNRRTGMAQCTVHQQHERSKIDIIAYYVIKV